MAPSTLTFLRLVPVFTCGPDRFRGNGKGMEGEREREKESLAKFEEGKRERKREREGERKPWKVSVGDWEGLELDSLWLVRRFVTSLRDNHPFAGPWQAGRSGWVVCWGLF